MSTADSKVEELDEKLGFFEKRQIPQSHVLLRIRLSRTDRKLATGAHAPDVMRRYEPNREHA
jgi:hypothetical protein